MSRKDRIFFVFFRSCSQTGEKQKARRPSSKRVFSDDVEDHRTYENARTIHRETTRVPRKNVRRLFSFSSRNFEQGKIIYTFCPIKTCVTGKKVTKNTPFYTFSSLCYTYSINVCISNPPHPSQHH